MVNVKDIVMETDVMLGAIHNCQCINECTLFYGDGGVNGKTLIPYTFNILIIFYRFHCKYFI